MQILKAGIAIERIAPGKPYQNGRHERFHLTLKRATCEPPAATMRAQQARFDVFKREYNEERPHEALQQRTPSELYEASPRALPKRLEEPEYPNWFEVTTVSRHGSVKLRGRSYFISNAVRNERIGLTEIEEGCWEVYFCKLLLGRIHTAHPELGLLIAA